MPKNLVIFCDGTWNSSSEEEYGTPAPTNVYRLYEACPGIGESGGRQATWYQWGVGSIGGRFRRAWEGATGTGISASIRRGYTAVARNYAPDDKIFLFGFSRGAFAARSIAGMIERVGLLTNPTRENVARAYSAYEHHAWDPDHEPAQIRDLDVHDGNVRIHFIGVWDTVGALGFPMWGWSFNLRDLFRNGFHEISPNKITDHVYQALAMDEFRTSFMPALWELPKTTEASGPAVEQAWFRGVHSDVGGGYADSRLADITLKWMIERAESHELLVRQNSKSSLRPDPAGRIHNSYKGPLWTNVAGWPRWFPPRNRSPDDPDAVSLGYLHYSVFQREYALEALGVKSNLLRTVTVGKPETIDVRADQLWNATSLVLEENATYVFDALGWWQDNNDTPVGPDGQMPSDESWLKKMARFGRRSPRQPWMKLIGALNYPRRWPWQERPLRDAFRYLILEDPSELVSELLPIGTRMEFTVPPGRTGAFWVFANDWWKFYNNNTGGVQLTVTRLEPNTRTNSKE